jgi:hypothetical protein
MIPLGLKAQVAVNFSNGIFKQPEPVVNSHSTPHLSDFSYQKTYMQNGSVLRLPRTKPAIAFLSSALIPGSGQAINGRWVRAGVYFTAEVAGLIYHFNRQAKAREQEKAYEAFTHRNWSVLAYAQWVVNYSQMHNLDNGWQSLDNYIAGKSPDFSNTMNDWNKVSISLLHSVETQTPFYFKDHIESEFSHELPEYGSQQYYELISKYYQFQAGWKDWYGAITTAPNQTVEMYRYFWNGQDKPNALFYEGRDRAEEFNDNYRVAGNILKLLVLNHIVSAFDALFTVQLKNSRIETDTNLLRMEQFSVSWHF